MTVDTTVYLDELGDERMRSDLLEPALTWRENQVSEQTVNGVTGDVTQDYQRATLSSFRRDRTQTFSDGVARRVSEVTTTVGRYTVASDGHGNSIQGDAFTRILDDYTRTTTTDEVTRDLDAAGAPLTETTRHAEDSEHVLQSSRLGNSVTGDVTRAFQRVEHSSSVEQWSTNQLRTWSHSTTVTAPYTVDDVETGNTIRGESHTRRSGTEGSDFSYLVVTTHDETTRTHDRPVGAFGSTDGFAVTEGLIVEAVSHTEATSEVLHTRRDGDSVSGDYSATQTMRESSTGWDLSNNQGRVWTYADLVESASQTFTTETYDSNSITGVTHTRLAAPYAATTTRHETTRYFGTAVDSFGAEGATLEVESQTTGTQEVLESGRHSNAVTGDFSLDRQVVRRSSTGWERSNNQGRLLSFADSITTVAYTATSESSGNTITGQTHTEGSATPRLTTRHEVTRYSAAPADSFEEVTTPVLEVVSVSTDVEEVLESSQDQNSLTGDYSGSQTVRRSSSSSEDTNNQGRVWTRSETETQEYVATSLTTASNAITGETHQHFAAPYTVTTTTRQSSRHYRDPVSGPGAAEGLVRSSSSEQTGTQEVLQSSRDGNDVTGEFDTRSTVRRHGTSSQTSNDQGRIVTTASSTTSPYTVVMTGQGSTLTGDSSSSEAPFEVVMTGTEQTSYLDAGGTVFMQVTAGPITTTEQIIASTRTSNSVTGAYASARTSTQVVDRLEESHNQGAETRVTTTHVSTESGTTEVGNSISGDYETHSADDWESDGTLTVDNQTLHVNETLPGSGQSRQDATGNRVTGEYHRTASSDSTSVRHEVITNRTLTATADKSLTSHAQSSETGNDLSGAYVRDELSTTSTRIDNAHDVNGSLSVTYVETTTDRREGIRSGNSITGLATDRYDVRHEVSLDRTSVNQTLTAHVTQHTLDVAQELGDGNTLLGDDHRVIVGRVQSSGTEDDVNQTLTVHSTSTSSEDYRREVTSNAVTGASSWLVTLDRNGHVHEVSTNQTLTATDDVTTSTHSESTYLGNTLTRAGVRGDESTTITTTDHTQTNQTDTFHRTETVTQNSSATDTRNAVTGLYATTQTTTGSYSRSHQSSNQTRSGSGSETGTTISGTEESGNEVTGDYARSATGTTTTSTERHETNTDQDVTSQTSVTSSSATQEVGNNLTGDFEQVSEGTTTSGLQESGTLGTRTLVTTEFITVTSHGEASGNAISSAVTSSDTSHEDYRRETDTAYPDGTSHAEAERRTDTTASGSANAITGRSESHVTTTTQSSAQESGDRGNPYSKTATSLVTTTVGRTANTVTGAYEQHDETTANETSGREVDDAAAGRLTLAEVVEAESASDQTGNAITGLYVRSSTSSSTTTGEQSSRSADGLVSIDSHSLTTTSEEATGGGNSVTGEVSGTVGRTITTTIDQAGSTPAGQVSYHGVSTTVETGATSGNLVTGILTTEATGTEAYEFTQDRESGDDTYHLIGEGTRTFTRQESQNTISGEVTKRTTGTDEFELTQTGTDAQGAYEVEVTGPESYVTTETGNSHTGAFERTTDVTGTDTQVLTRGGASQTQEVAADLHLTQAGNYLDGHLSQSATGGNRYGQLVVFTDSSNAGTATPGVVDFSPVGAMLAWGQQPADPADALAARAALSNAELLARHGQDVGSQAEAFRGGTGAAVEAGPSAAGVQLVHEYCFAAGTLVRLADGSARRIEEVRAGDRVLAVPDGDALAAPEGREVVRVYHNAPAEILTLHVGDEVIRTTMGHPFYVRGRGWVLSAKLRVGDELRTEAGDWVAISDVFANGEVEPVYNLEVQGHHTYFVVLEGSGVGVLVHNQSSVVNFFVNAGKELYKLGEELVSAIAAPVIAVADFLLMGTIQDRFPETATWARETTRDMVVGAATLVGAAAVTTVDTLTGGLIGQIDPGLVQGSRQVLKNFAVTLVKGPFERIREAYQRGGLGAAITRGIGEVALIVVPSKWLGLGKGIANATKAVVGAERVAAASKALGALRALPGVERVAKGLGVVAEGFGALRGAVSARLGTLGRAVSERLGVGGRTARRAEAGAETGFVVVENRPSSWTSSDGRVTFLDAGAYGAYERELLQQSPHFHQARLDEFRRIDLQWKPIGDIRKELTDMGFTAVNARSGGEVWTKSIGNGLTGAVRIDPPNLGGGTRKFADIVAHAHKEVVPTPNVLDPAEIGVGNYLPRNVVMSFDNDGNLVASLDAAGNLRSTATGGGLSGGERSLTHIPIIIENRGNWVFRGGSFERP